MSYDYTITDHDIHKLAYLKCPRKIAQYLGVSTQRVELAFKRTSRGRSKRRPEGNFAGDNIKVRPSVFKEGRVEGEAEQSLSNIKNRDATIALGQALENYWNKRPHRRAA